MRMKYLLNVVCFDTGSMYVADILCWHWGPPWPLRLYEQLHCFAINNSWPLPIARRKIFSTLIFPKIGFLQCSNILKTFSTTDPGRDILLFSTPFPRMSYGNNLPLLLSNMRKTHKINCAKGFERMKSNNSDVDYCSKYLEHDEFNYDCSVNIISVKVLWSQLTILFPFKQQYYELVKNCEMSRSCMLFV